MRKHYWAGLMVGLLATTPAMAQDYLADFKAAYQQGDTAATWQVLQRWQQARPRDPEAYIARFNYLLKQAEMLELRSGNNGRPGSLTFKDKKGQVAGTIGQGYRPDLAEQACAELRRGLVVAPERLDMWFGLAKTYEETGQPDEQVKVLTEALATHAKTPGTPWRWRDGQPLPEPEAEFMPAALEQYLGYYWRQQPPAAETGRQLAELIVQYYPQSSLGPFNMGVYYNITGKYQQAYDALRQADQLQPNDLSTVANLTSLAINLKRKAEAQQYLARLQKMPDGKEAAAEFAPRVKKLK